MKETSCCFTGHRVIPETQKNKIISALEKEIKVLAENGTERFYSGGALGFDTEAAKAVLKMKKFFPDIKLILALPCMSQALKWSKSDRLIYEKITAQADEVIYTSHEYYSGCMHKRNRYMAEQSAYCICYITKNSGGTAYTVNYAKALGLSIINIADKI